MQLTRVRGLLLVIAIGGVIVACSSAGTTVDVGGGFSRAGGVAPVGSTSASGPTTPPRCPADPPTPRSGCADLDVTCTYGPDVRDECAEKWECAGGRWRDISGTCAFACPATHDEIAVGSPCGDNRMACSYEEGTCGCVHEGPLPPFDGGSGDASVSTGDAGDAGDGGFTKPLVPGVWKCVAPPTDVACPSTRPRVLDECVKPVTCDYGTCVLGQDLSYDCKGIWQPSFEQKDCP